jgi:hypothetical protein
MSGQAKKAIVASLLIAAISGCSAESRTSLPTTDTLSNNSGSQFASKSANRTPIPLAALINGPRHAGPLVHRASWMTKAATKAPVVYVSDYNNNEVDVYSAKSLRLVGQLTSAVDNPAALVTDTRGNLYVGDNGNGPSGANRDFAVTVFKKGATNPNLILFCSGYPSAITVSKTGIVYVAFINGWIGPDDPTGVDVFATKGSSSVSYMISDPSFSEMTSLALDSAGDLYIGGRTVSGPGQIIRVPPGSRGLRNKSLSLNGLGLPTGIFIDKQNDLVVSDEATSAIETFKAGQTSPSTVVGAQNVGYTAFSASGATVWSPTFEGATVNVLRYPSGTVTRSITATATNPSLVGVALSPT